MSEERSVRQTVKERAGEGKREDGGIEEMGKGLIEGERG